MKYDFDLIVIGGGAAGLTASGIGGMLGARTLLVEKNRMGGDCTWTGCIPSKSLIRSSNMAQAVREAGTMGVGAGSVRIDGRAVLSRVRSIRGAIYEHADTPERIAAFGVEVALAKASFTGPHELRLESSEGSDSRLVTGRRILIATGSRPGIPSGLRIDNAPYLTTDSLFELEQLPSHVAIVGAGPSGVELSQSLRRLGCDVTLFECTNRILPGEDEEGAELVGRALESEGVEMRLATEVKRLEGRDGGLRVHFETRGESGIFDTSHVLLATGRVPNLDLGLDRAGVRHTGRGIWTDRQGRTSRANIFAAGDVTGRFHLTHMSEHTAKIATLAALLRYPGRFRMNVVPRTTGTAPEFAQVGPSVRELEERGTPFETYRFPYDRLDRAVTDGRTTGFIKLFARRITGRVLGGVVVGEAAGELASQIALAATHRLTLRQVSDTIYPYPSYGIGVRRAADQWYIRRYSPRVLSVIGRAMGFRGRVFRDAADRII